MTDQESALHHALSTNPTRKMLQRFPPTRQVFRFLAFITALLMLILLLPSISNKFLSPRKHNSFQILESVRAREVFGANKFRRRSHNTTKASPTSVPAYPLDVEYLNRSFETLISTAAGIYGDAAKARKLYKVKYPQMNYGIVRASTPSGRNLSLDDIKMSIHDPPFVVPSAVHFVLPFYDAQLEFHHLVCILSAYWINKPKKLIFWYLKPMTGTWWNYLRRNITDFENKVVMIYRPMVTSIYHNFIGVKEHKSDVIRMEGLLILGGMYFDLDVITLNDMNPLRRFNFTIGRERRDGLCNGVMVSAPNSTFLSLWHVAYQSFLDHQWAHHSVNLPHYMAIKFPHLVHVEEESMDRPNWMETNKIYGKDRSWDWQNKNYCMHLWYRFHKKQYNIETIGAVDSMLGEMFRFVLFGNRPQRIKTRTERTPFFANDSVN